jgi:hypothetical protein
MKINAHITDIDWDTDDEEVFDLPNEFDIEVIIDEEFLETADFLGDIIGDAISNEYGFCHYGFDYEIIKEN